MNQMESHENDEGKLDHGTHVLKRLQEVGTEDAQRLVDAFNARYPYMATLAQQTGSEAPEDGQ
jgi:1,2-phenylacetyl-CoA epoxidase catalytic subunit